jgi:hypothetical protein
VIERTATDAAASRGAAAAAYVRPADDMVPRWLPPIRRVLAVGIKLTSIKHQDSRMKIEEDVNRTYVGIKTR